MDERTLAALKESITHWERLASGDADPEREEVGPHQCALCKLFWKRLPIETLAAGQISVSCEGCPVKAKSGRDGCLGTPFDKVMTLLEEYDDSGVKWGVIVTMDDFKAAAADELAFLKTLLPT